MGDEAAIREAAPRTPRRRETFVLVLVQEANQSLHYRGRVRHIVSGWEVTFQDWQDLARHLEKFMAWSGRAQKGGKGS